MILSTLNNMPNKEFQVLGLVQGSIVQSKELKGRDSFKVLVEKGEIKPYSEKVEQAREIAKQRMIEEANELKADAIIDINFSFNTFNISAFEILVYGTAIKFI